MSQCFYVKIQIYQLKTLGRCPNTPPVFEKTGQKLLSKRNYIAFFGNPFAIFLKPSPGRRCHFSDGWGTCLNINYVFHIIYFLIFPSSASTTSQHLLPREGFKTKPFRQATLDTFPFRDGFRNGFEPQKSHDFWFAMGFLLKIFILFSQKPIYLTPDYRADKKSFRFLFLTWAF